MLYYFILLFFISAFVQADTCDETSTLGKAYYVSPDGLNYKGDGSRLHPWKTIPYGISQIPDGNTLIIKPGVYNGRVRISKKYSKGLLLKSEIPYQAKLINNQRVVALLSKASNITIEGFEITHSDKNAKPLVVHIDAWGGSQLKNITIRNNIIHDSYNNDLLKINYGAEHITIECNMFYNQGDSDEHIDINSVANITISDNVFFNDFPKSGRKITKKSSSFIVIKDSNGKEDRFLGAENIIVERNIFFNWQGSHGQGFVLIGEDGKPYYEASDVEIFNNLMIGNSPISMRAPLMIKGAKNINFYNNTVTGDLPSNAFAIRITKEGQNKKPTNINLFNNIWSDPYGTMGQGAFESNNDFSDTFFYQIGDYSLKNNLYWNKNIPLPSSISDKINPSDDSFMRITNPKLNNNSNLTPPIWQANKNQFSDGSFNIREVFLRLVYYYGIPQQNTVNRNKTLQGTFPKEDILKNLRTNSLSIGAFQFKSTEH